MTIEAIHLHRPANVTYATVRATPDGRLSADSAATYLGINRATLANYRCKGIGPKFSKLGRLVFYKLSDLDEWLAIGGEA